MFVPGVVLCTMFQDLHNIVEEAAQWTSTNAIAVIIQLGTKKDFHCVVSKEAVSLKESEISEILCSWP